MELIAFVPVKELSINERQALGVKDDAKSRVVLVPEKDKSLNVHEKILRNFRASVEV